MLLASEFMEKVKQMIGGAIPMIELNKPDKVKGSRDKRTTIISEYPGIIIGGKRNENAVSILDLLSSNTSAVENGIRSSVTAFDVGHRHWSMLHWFYPGTFHPFTFMNNFKSSRQRSILYEAAHNTMVEKSSNGGGHTGWSAVWALALFARIRDKKSIWIFLKRVLQQYTALNLLGLHPALVDSNIDGCSTCFHDQDIKLVNIKHIFSFNISNSESATIPKLAKVDMDILRVFRNRMGMDKRVKNRRGSLKRNSWEELGYFKFDDHAPAIKSRQNIELFRSERGMITNDNAKVRSSLNFYFA